MGAAFTTRARCGRRQRMPTSAAASALSYEPMTVRTHLEELERALAALPETLVGEIIFGQLVTQPRPASPHARAASIIGGALIGPFDRGRGGPGGWIILDEPELQLGPHVLVPDIAGFRRDTMPEMPNVARFQVRPDWVCEVLSPSTAPYDRDEKMTIYAANDVGHLWLVDPRNETIEAYRSERGRWFRIGNFIGHEDAVIPPFDAIPLPLADLWSR